NRLMNVLFPRIPLWDPDRFLKRWLPLNRVFFSKIGALLWLAVVIAAIVALVPMWDAPGHSLKQAGLKTLDIRDNPVNLLLLCDVNSVPAMLAFNSMLIASVTTIVFNANPLLRYDGYYILSDFLEIPNLRQKSTEYTLGLIKRHVFRLKLQQPLPPSLQRFWL